MNDAVLVSVKELDGILDSEHMIGLLFVDLVDDGGQGRGFARASRSGYQYDSVAQVDDLVQFGRQIERFQVWNLSGNYTHHDGTSTTLHENVHAKPIGAGHTVGHIRAPAFLQLLNGVVVAADEIGPVARGVVNREGRSRSGGR